MRTHIRLAGLLLVALVPLAMGDVQCEDAPLPPPPPPAVFDGERGFSDAAALVALGERPAGSEGARLAQNLIIERLEAAGLVVRQDTFTAETPAGDLPMKNVIGVLPGERPGVILIGAHFDTKRIPGVTFLGANDGAAGTAAVLELARTLKARAKPLYSYWFVFFDGEEAVGEWSEADGIYGSRHLVNTLRDQNLLGNLRTMILLDLIGDADLTVMKESTSYARYRDLFWQSARELGHGDAFVPDFVTVADDHQPFAEAGIRAVNLIDFMYGDRSVPGKYWHTPEDTLDKISVRSLQIVGEVVLATLPKIERFIDVIESRTGFAPLPAVTPDYLGSGLAESEGDAVGAALGAAPPEGAGLANAPADTDGGLANAPEAGAEAEEAGASDDAAEPGTVDAPADETPEPPAIAPDEAKEEEKKDTPAAAEASAPPSKDGEKESVPTGAPEWAPALPEGGTSPPPPVE